MKLVLRLALVFCLCSVSVAQTVIDSCGSGPLTEARIAALHKWVQGKERERRVRSIQPLAEKPAELVNGIFVTEATAANSPFLKRNDLNNSSLFFARREDGSFTVTRRALTSQAPLGVSVKTFVKDSSNPDWHVHQYQLKNFQFPFHDRQVSTIYVSALNAIFLESPNRSRFFQYGPLEAMTQSKPVIAPLLLTERNPAAIVQPNVFIDDTAEVVTITWRTVEQNIGYFRYSTQARLFRNGDIEMSWRNLQNLAWGSVLVTSGQEAIRSASAGISTASDATGDVDPRTEAALVPMLDVESAEVNRLGDSNLLQLRITLKSPIDRTLIREDSPLQFFVDFSDEPGEFDQGVLLTVKKNGADNYFITGWAESEHSPAAMIDGRTVTLHLLQEQMAFPAPDRKLAVFTSHLLADYFTDDLVVPVTIGAPARRIESDLSTFNDPVAISGPLLESFVAPAFNPFSVLDDLKTQYRLRDDEVDAVAMYQTYMTEIVFWAGAYSTGGNPGVDGIRSRSNYGTGVAKRPALLHMNTFDYGWNSTERGSTSVSLHEVGHRWLYGFRIREDGRSTASLNPDGGHPAEWVHTPAPFNVYSEGDASTMGGARWTDNGDGSFTAASSLGFYSFSWTDLYLMGLAAPEEVEPWFYIQNSNPALNRAYSPAPGTTVTGTRKNVEIQQLISSMGPRNPSHLLSPRSFTVYFVLVTEPGVAATPLQIAKMETHRRLLEEKFRVATGGRGQLQTYFRFVDPDGPRRRGVRR